jgi:hypothetical protein
MDKEQTYKITDHIMSTTISMFPILNWNLIKTPSKLRFATHLLKNR